MNIYHPKNSSCAVPLFCLQVGYWNENEKYVSTATYAHTLNETFGMHNRTYIVTTILVSGSCQLHYF